MSVDRYFDLERKPGYTCLHFADHVWHAETGRRLAGRVGDFLMGVAALGAARQYERLQRPLSPCIVLLKGRTTSHIGIYIRGKVLHLGKHGPQYEELSVVSIGFSQVRFYRC